MRPSSICSAGLSQIGRALPGKVASECVGRVGGHSFFSDLTPGFPRSDCLHGRKWTVPTLHSVVLCGGVVAPGPAVGQEACDGQGVSCLVLLGMGGSTCEGTRSSQGLKLPEAPPLQQASAASVPTPGVSSCPLQGLSIQSLFRLDL